MTESGISGFENLRGAEVPDKTGRDAAVSFELPTLVS